MKKYLFSRKKILDLKAGNLFSLFFCKSKTKNFQVDKYEKIRQK